MSKHIARETEYKKIKYKSKSEAILAYCMDKAGYKYEYEPELKCHGLEWKPDFIVFDERSNCIFLLEYKPCKVTETYLNWIKNEFKKVRKLNCSNLMNLGQNSFVDTSFILEKNFYQHGGIWIHDLGEWPECIITNLTVDKILTKINPFIEDAKQYRFDLCQ